MGVKINLRKQVDLPVWEYCRFAPTVTTAVSSLTTGNTLHNRFLYYQVSGLLYRYDTVGDTWQQLASNPNVPTIMNNNVLSNAVGHYGQAISGGASTIRLAGLSGNTLVGYKIRILDGTGAGQERTIISISTPIIEDRGIVTTASLLQIIDASTGVGVKAWTANKWKNYQVRIDYGSGKSICRPILYNTDNRLSIADSTHLGINPWAWPYTPATVVNSTLYVIESHIATVDTPWDVVPDSTSSFVILSGGIWNISQGTTSAPFFTLMYYDILTDTWYYKSTQTGLKTAVFLAASDLTMERITESGGAIVSSTAVANGKERGFVSSVSMTPMAYANHEVRIVNGTGKGQIRTILSNTATSINVTRDWDVIPDVTSYYEVWADCGKLWLTGGNDAALLQYSIDSDQWSTGKQLDFGQCNQLAAKKSGNRPIALTSITRNSGGITQINAIPTAGGSGYSVNDLLTVSVGSNGTLRVTNVSSTGAVLSVSLETPGSGHTIGTGKATTVTPTGGTGCTVEIEQIDYVEYAVTGIFHNLQIGDFVTISGATGTGALKFNGYYQIIGVNLAASAFYYYSIGDPGAASATIASSPSTTTLVDCTKSWTPNEHVGKLIQLATNTNLSVGQVRRIISNTATTITWTLAATAPTNGISRYIIEDIKPFGTERMMPGIVGGGTEGFATGGTSTTLEDSTKNWPVNCWSKTVNRKVRIVEGTGVGSEIAILSNTANTLTFAAQTFTPDASTRYVIMDTFGTATGGTTTTLVDTNQNWATNVWIWKRVRFLSGTSQGNEYIITANTSNTLTFAAGTAPDVSTAYAILEACPKAYGIHLDRLIGCSDPVLNQHYIYAWTGTGTNELSRYHIPSERWELMSYFPNSETFTTGTMYCYDGKDRIYVWNGTLNKLLYYDIVKNEMYCAGTPPYGMSTAYSGNRMEIIETEDGLKYLYLMRHTGTEMWRLLLFF